MLRIIYFFCIMFLLICSFLGIAYYVKDISIIYSNQIYQISPLVALSLVYFLLFAFLLLSKIFFSFTSFLASIFQKHNHAKEFTALSTGLIAIAAQNKVLARKMSAYVSYKFTPQNESLIHLLEAQVALSDKEYLVAHAKFERMLQILPTREFALYGLYNESCRQGDFQSAKRYAERAIDISSKASWCVEAILYDYVSAKEWSKAIVFLNQHKNNIDIEEYNRNKSILLTARSLESLALNNVIAAYNDAIDALKLCNDSIMASISAAKSLILQKKTSKAEVILEKIWRINPHPEIAHIYTTISSNDSKEYLQRAFKLESLNKKSVESLIIIIKTALKNCDIDQARAKAMHAIKITPRKEIYLILAEIEQTYSHNLNQALYWTKKALYAIPDPLWIAEDGFLSETWLPASPISRKICNFSWNNPVKIPEYNAYQCPKPSKLDNSTNSLIIDANNTSHIYKDLNFHNWSSVSFNPPLRQPDDPGIKTENHKK
ncbi:MAG: heme biosynthesis protein HemY [Candidatus Liberibacter ctenarytainae]|uniref:Heme biosynthesis protein HemY n=1 Tax=Candidatus Liberibacter ctenarytainae TaxID=2020335 RepID=A0A937DLK9_9HYPH|nr:heme biosynthesis protein HemY [Candidatus Liberibacter ctenarytainae]